jgi:hypothetical protein
MAGCNAKKAYAGRSSKCPHIINFDNRWRSVDSSSFRPLYPRVKMLRVGWSGLDVMASIPIIPNCSRCMFNLRLCKHNIINLSDIESN